MRCQDSPSASSPALCFNPSRMQFAFLGSLPDCIIRACRADLTANLANIRNPKRELSPSC